MLVIFVHGTFARDAKWTHNNALFAQHLRSHFPADDPELSIQQFSWSGRNSHVARLRAAKALAQKVEHARNIENHDRIIVVSHSHGGNVALFAQNFLNEDQQIDGLVTMGTPFLEVSLRPEFTGANLRKLYHSAKYGWLQTMLLGIAVFTIYMVLMMNIAVPLAQQFGDTVGMFAVLITLYTPFALFFWLRERLSGVFYLLSAQRAALRMLQAFSLPKMPGIRVLSFEYKGDEAGTLLSVVSKPSDLMFKTLDWLRLSRHLALRQIPIVGIVLASILIILEYSFSSKADEADIVDHVMLVFLLLCLPAIAWFMATLVGNVAALLRGHPGGFGWERPAIHSFVRIHSTAKPQLGIEDRHHHVALQQSEKHDKSGLKHSHYYDDPAVISLTCKWIEEQFLTSHHSRNNVQ